MVGLAAYTPGLGAVYLGPAAQAEAVHATKLWRQRNVQLIAMGLSAAMGCIYLVVWCLRRSEQAFGWYALMSLCWVVYMATILATDAWPFDSIQAHSRLNNISFLLYVTAFCLFTWRFGEQSLPRAEKLLWVTTGLGLLGGRLASSMHRIEHFNQELQEHVAQASTELAEALAREHDQALFHARLRERMAIVHDLHDGLGGSLVRSLALVEQTKQPLTNERVLSMLKVLRDDLRQVIDYESTAGTVVPETPTQWIAPLRHRFTRLLDELGVAISWQVPEQWCTKPSALHCLGLARLVEEALSNVIKHSRAHHVRVRCTQPAVDSLLVEVEDDGVGFHLEAVREGGLGVGMRSIAARAERMGGDLEIASGPEGTLVSVRVRLAQGRE